MAKVVNVTVPATTANLGPGFDCLGLALDLCNQTIFKESKSGRSIEVVGEGAESLPTDDSNLVLRAAESVFERTGRRPAGFRVKQENKIPVGSGLGSSAAAVLGGILAANELIGNPLSQNEALEMAAEMEGHPDNVVPALLGGLTIAVSDAGTLVVERIRIPELRVVVVLPDHSLSTHEARSVLPQTVPMADAVFNISRTALLIKALEQGDYEHLALAMEDRLHQPYRLPLIPGMAEAFNAGRHVGAAAVALSGAGPSLVAFAPENHEQIAVAIGKVFESEGLSARSWVLAVHRSGSRIEVETGG
jgi:homoserine kinase